MKIKNRSTLKSLVVVLAAILGLTIFASRVPAAEGDPRSAQDPGGIMVSEADPVTPLVEERPVEAANPPYTVGVDDVLEIEVTQPESLLKEVTVSPDGFISFIYIGEVAVKGKTLGEIQEGIEARLADGYLEYPVVAVSLKESRSRKFFVYGEVAKPGTYPLEDKTTVLRAISMAGGFTKFGSTSNAKLLRVKKDQPGYDTIKINIKAVMDGDSKADLMLQNGDILVLSVGVF
jgi:polysaccharide export outer membrane protein